MTSLDVLPGAGAESKIFHTKTVTIPVPTPGPTEVLIRVHVAGSNPKDWKLPAWGVQSGNTGDDLAGTVAAFGAEVTGFSVGDRVGAFHVMMALHGAFAEFAIAPAHTTFHLPPNVSYEAAAGLPLAYLTAVQGLYTLLGLPTPLDPRPTAPIPLLVYGAATAVGAATVKLAAAAGIGPIIAVAGRGCDFVRSILPPGSTLIDYRAGNVEDALRAVLADTPCTHAIDAVSLPDTIATSANVLAPGATLGIVLPTPEGYEAPAGVDVQRFNVGWSHDMGALPGQERSCPESRALAEKMLKWAMTEMEAGRFEAHPTKVIEGGLKGVEKGLGMLERNEVSACKLVYRVVEE
ncbi:chaperonin 10-like protein [Geopyxis carbonaria]|nr:chaperonin 10-like protein [Geopyxis carbonaria]